MAAAVVPSPDQVAGLMQNLSLDSQTKTNDVSQPTKKSQPMGLKFVSNGYGPVGDHVVAPYPPFGYPQIGYPQNGYAHTAYAQTAYHPQGGYYIEGYDEAGNYVRIPRQDAGFEVPAGVYPDTGSLAYQHGHGYLPPGSYATTTTPVPVISHDSQFYGQYPFQYQSPSFPVSASGMTYTSTPAAIRQGEWPSGATGLTPYTAEPAKTYQNFVPYHGGKGTNGSVPFQPLYPNSAFTTSNPYGQSVLPSASYQDARFGSDRIMSPVSWLGGPIFDGQPRPVNSNSFSSSFPQGFNGPAYKNQNLRPHTNTMGSYQPRPHSGLGTTHGFANKMLYPSNFFAQYVNGLRSGISHGYSGYEGRSSGRGWFPGDSKYKNRGRGNSFFSSDIDMDGMNELSKGPRSKSSKNQKSVAPTSLAVEGECDAPDANHDEVKNNADATLGTEIYNQPDFPDTYTDAKFFIIKSYSEDDVHNSIKYSVWSSTPNGNRKLDAAYQEAQEKSGSCPVFLFFSVNTSGQFVGAAEMVGAVDFHAKVEYWQQDKWTGSFPVKWHIVKDVPNSLLKHITLEYNENKSVTNSRDTQEVKLEEGLQMLKIFREHVTDASILEDFDFYEERQKTIREKKARQQQFQKQVLEGKNLVEKGKPETNGDPKLVESLDIPDVIQEISLDGKLLDASTVTENNDASKTPEPEVSENRLEAAVASDY